MLFLGHIYSVLEINEIRQQLEYTIEIQKVLPEKTFLTSFFPQICSCITSQLSMARSSCMTACHCPQSSFPESVIACQTSVGYTSITFFSTEMFSSKFQYEFINNKGLHVCLAYHGHMHILKDIKTLARATTSWIRPQAMLVSSDSVSELELSKSGLLTENTPNLYWLSSRKSLLEAHILS